MKELFEYILIALACPLVLPLVEPQESEVQISLGSSCQSWISDVGLSNATVAVIEADKAERSENRC